MNATLRDLHARIAADPALSPAERADALARVRAVYVTTSQDTRVDAVMPVLIGAGLGALIARYFGGGGAAMLLSAAAGGAIGRSMFGPQSKDPYAGFNVF